MAAVSYSLYVDFSRGVEAIERRQAFVQTMASAECHLVKANGAVRVPGLWGPEYLHWYLLFKNPVSNSSYSGTWMHERRRRALPKALQSCSGFEGCGRATRECKFMQEDPDIVIFEWHLERYSRALRFLALLAAAIGILYFMVPEKMGTFLDSRLPVLISMFKVGVSLWMISLTSVCTASIVYDYWRRARISGFTPAQCRLVSADLVFEGSPLYSSHRCPVTMLNKASSPCWRISVLHTQMGEGANPAVTSLRDTTVLPAFLNGCDSPNRCNRTTLPCRYNPRDVSEVVIPWETPWPPVLLACALSLIYFVVYTRELLLSAVL